MLISFANLKQKYDMNIKGVIHIGAHFGEEVKDYIDNGMESGFTFNNPNCRYFSGNKKKSLLETKH